MPIRQRISWAYLSSSWIPLKLKSQKCVYTCHLLALTLNKQFGYQLHHKNNILVFEGYVPSSRDDFPRDDFWGVHFCKLFYREMFSWLCNKSFLQFLQKHHAAKKHNIHFFFFLAPSMIFKGLGKNHFMQKSPRWSVKREIPRVVYNFSFFFVCLMFKGWFTYVW